MGANAYHNMYQTPYRTIADLMAQQFRFRCHDVTQTSFDCCDMLYMSSAALRALARQHIPAILYPLGIRLPACAEICLVSSWSLAASPWYSKLTSTRCILWGRHMSLASWPRSRRREDPVQLQHGECDPSSFRSG